MKFFHFGHKKEGDSDKSNSPSPSKAAKAVAAGAGAVGLAITGAAATGNEAPKPDAVVTVGGSPTPENQNTEVMVPTTPTTEISSITAPTTEAPDTPVTIPPGEKPIENPTTSTMVGPGNTPYTVIAPGLTDPNQAPTPNQGGGPQDQLPGTT